MQAQFTPREVAELSGTPKRTVEKAIEEKVFTTKMVKRGRRQRRMLPAHAVAYALIVRRVSLSKGASMAAEARRRRRA